MRITRTLAIAVSASLVLIALLGIFAPWSPSAWYALGAVALGATSRLAHERGPRRSLAIVAGVLLAILLCVRVVGSEGGMIRMITLPQRGPSRILARLVDEQDVALLGARAFALRWPLSPDERAGLLSAMVEAYADMRRDDVITPSPVADTLLARQKPEAFDTLVIEPRATTGPAPKYGVIFLHGYAGSHTLECWLIAKAAQTVGAVTVCPATGFSGHWRGEAAEGILRASLDYLHRRGVQRVFLAGLSNGAAGASALAPSFAPSLSGLVLISGAPAGGGNAGLPTLVVHGNQDAVASITAAKAFAARTRSTFAGFSGGHFVLLLRREETRKVIADWLLARLGLHET